MCVSAFIRLHLACKNLEEDSLRIVVRTNECDFVPWVYRKGEVIDDLFTIDCL